MHTEPVDLKFWCFLNFIRKSYEGLLNYTYKPRKPVPLGTMFRNGVECISGILVYQDVV
jgi:hypothetical protein